jgi:hypothetical protein
MEHEQISSAVGWLVDDWCEVRKLKPLGHLLAAYPLEGAAPADWARLRDALQRILGTCAEELGEAEKEKLRGILATVEPLAAR